MTETIGRRVHRQLTINTISNVSRHVLQLAITFVMTPFIVRTLGDTLYGFWLLLVAFIGYASVLEMSVQPAVVKLVAQFRGSEDKARLQSLITAALAFYLVVGAIASTLILFVVPSLVRNHVEGLQSLPGGMLLFGLIAIDTALMYLNYLFTGVLYGYQRYHLHNIIEALGWILNAALLLIFLEGGGILALVACKLAMDVFIVTGIAVASLRLLPGFRLRPSALRRDSFTELISFGGRVFFSGATTRIATQSQPLIISTMLNAAATTFYGIPAKVVDNVRGAGWVLTSAFMPMFSELQSRNEQDLLRSIYLQYTRYIFMILLPAVVLLFVYGTPFLHVWISPVNAEMGHLPLMLLTATMLVDSAQPLIWRFFLGVGKVDFLVKISVAGSIFAVLSCIALVKPLGISGVALSMLLATVGAQSIYAIQSSRYFEIPLRSIFAQAHLRPLLAGGVTFACAALLESLLGSSSYLQMCLGAAATLLIYAVLGVTVALTSKERDLLRRWISSVLARSGTDSRG